MDNMRRKQRGLTLVELMVTLAVAIVLLAVGMPMFTGVVGSNRATSEANALLSAIQLARSEAVKRGSYVLVAPASSSWAPGWTVYQENNVPGETSYGIQGSDEPTLRVWPEVTAVIDAGSTAFIGFDRMGEADTAVALQFTNDDASGVKRRCLIVSLSGQSRVKREIANESWTCP